MAATYTLNQPITFENGTGFNTTPTTAITAADNTTVTFAIGQDVGSGSNVVFNQVSASTPPLIIDLSLIHISEPTRRS